MQQKLSLAYRFISFLYVQFHKIQYKLQILSTQWTLN